MKIYFAPNSSLTEWNSNVVVEELAADVIFIIVKLAEFRSKETDGESFDREKVSINIQIYSRYEGGPYWRINNV